MSGKCLRDLTCQVTDQPSQAVNLLGAAAGSAVGGTVRDTEWGMVGLGIILGAAFALVMGFIFHLLSEYWHKGTQALLITN